MVDHDSISIGPIDYIAQERKLTKGKRSVRLEPRQDPILQELVRRLHSENRVYTFAEFRAGKWGGTKLKSIISDLRGHFRNLGAERMVSITNVTKKGYFLDVKDSRRPKGDLAVQSSQLPRLVDSKEKKAVPVGVAPFDVERSADQRENQLGNEFSLFLEGMTLNPAAELLYGAVDEVTGSACRRLYKASIEDFAFAVVFSSNVSSLWLPSEELAMDRGTRHTRVKTKPSALLMADLPTDFYRKCEVDPQFRYGQLLKDETAWTRIGEYIRTFAASLEIAGFRAYCREWFEREAHLYFGNERRLFDPRADVNSLTFGKKYYDSPYLKDVPKLLGKDKLGMLTSFLPDTPREDRKKRLADRYTAKSRERFALLNILTHFTVMYEYEQISRVSGVQTMLSTIRSGVRRQWHSARRPVEMNILKRIAVRSALYEALEQSKDGNDRDSLLEMLLWVRDQEDFRRLRHRIEELNGLARMDEASAIAGARNLLAEISSDRKLQSDVVNYVGIDRYAVMGPSGSFGRIGTVRSGSYMRLFERYFSELFAGQTG